MYVMQQYFQNSPLTYQYIYIIKLCNLIHFKCRTENEKIAISLFVLEIRGFTILNGQKTFTDVQNKISQECCIANTIHHRSRSAVFM